MPIIKISTKGVKEITKALEKNSLAAEKALGRAMSDIKKRVPGIVSTEVTGSYNIKKKEVMPAKKLKDGTWTKSVGRISTSGKIISEVVISYEGRTLTPVHFGMTPVRPKPGRGGYTLKAHIKKGSPKILGKVKPLGKKQLKNITRNLKKEGTKNSPYSPIMLMHTGNTKVDGTNYIPFRRQSQNRKDIEPIKTLSLPQMIDNPKVRREIESNIWKMIGNRVEHHTKNL